MQRQQYGGSKTEPPVKLFASDVPINVGPNVQAPSDEHGTHIQHGSFRKSSLKTAGSMDGMGQRIIFDVSEFAKYQQHGEYEKDNDSPGGPLPKESLVQMGIVSSQTVGVSLAFLGLRTPGRIRVDGTRPANGIVQGQGQSGRAGRERKSQCHGVHPGFPIPSHASVRERIANHQEIIQRQGGIVEDRSNPPLDEKALRRARLDVAHIPSGPGNAVYGHGPRGEEPGTAAHEIAQTHPRQESVTGCDPFQRSAAAEGTGAAGSSSSSSLSSCLDENVPKNQGGSHKGSRRGKFRNQRQGDLLGFRYIRHVQCSNVSIVI